MTTLRLPFLDHDGSLSPLVNEAMVAGATADRGPVNGTETFDLTFKTKKAADAFRAKLNSTIEVSEVANPVAEVEAPASDPVDEPAAE